MDDPVQLHKYETHINTSQFSAVDNTLTER